MFRKRIELLEIPLFSGLDRVNKAKLLPELEDVHYREGDVIFRQGDFGDSLYIIAQGTVSVCLGEGDARREINRLGEQESFGEMALLTGEPRSATIVAVDDVILLRLSKERFEILLKKDNNLAVQFAGILARRLAVTGKQLYAKQLALTAAGVGEALPMAAPASAAGLIAERPKAEAAAAEIAGADGAVTVTKKANLEGAPVSPLAKVPALARFLRGRKQLTLVVAVVTSLLLHGLLLGVGLQNNHAVLIDLIWGATVLWSSNLFSHNIINLALPVLAVLLGGAMPEKAFSGFSSPT
ncbi:cyclic nucleotide-binding domain-containing protein [Heliobacterium undosum]|uniref:Cyclic nucleotide-binding domain-containing protein n=1 Tax=Heliomicrobium undosum TaxID=121734 RepID=A0A845KZ12_9FIRM|nr:cyclic nucleotide-binding domain-containing protein [Heliomicrobium undosum]MZP29237.1 cyclic nucleotide-binding domain-containing protein [Heliomicrobium undosum]